MTAGAVVSDAEECALAAAARSGLTVVELHDPAQQRAASTLLSRIWRTNSLDALVNPALMRAFDMSGNYVAGAYHEADLVGVAVGFRGEGHLHSDVVGVSPDAQRSGIGYALKLHQRAWSLRHGISEVRWTYDPLIRRNAYFNLRKLGAVVTRYLPDFYGQLGDGVNGPDVTDRLYVHWRLESPRVVDAAHGRAVPVPSLAAVTQVSLDGDAPVSHPVAGGTSRLVALPADIESIRTRDAALAATWRRVVRDALAPALAEGWEIESLSDAGEYVLTRGERS